MANVFHFYDAGEGITVEFDTIEAAIAAANLSIDTTRHTMDGEWPEYVEGHAVYLAPAGCEDPDEVGTLVAQSIMLDVKDKPDDCDEHGYSGSLGLSFANVDFYCDYKVEAVHV